MRICKFCEFLDLENSQIFVNLKILWIFRFSNFAIFVNLWISVNSKFKSNKFAKLRRFSKNCQVFEFFFSIFSITCNFVNTNICSLILIYFVALSTWFFPLYSSYSRNNFYNFILKFYCSKFWLPPFKNFFMTVESLEI